MSKNIKTISFSVMLFLCCGNVSASFSGGSSVLEPWIITDAAHISQEMQLSPVDIHKIEIILHKDAPTITGSEARGGIPEPVEETEWLKVRVEGTNKYVLISDVLKQCSPETEEELIRQEEAKQAQLDEKNKEYQTTLANRNRLIQEKAKLEQDNQRTQTRIRELDDLGSRIEKLIQKLKTINDVYRSEEKRQEELTQKINDTTKYISEAEQDLVKDREELKRIEKWAKAKKEDKKETQRQVRELEKLDMYDENSNLGIILFARKAFARQHAAEASSLALRVRTKEEDLERTHKDLAKMQRTKTESIVRIKDLIQRKTKTDQELQQVKAELATAEQQKKDLGGRIEANTKRLKELEEQIPLAEHVKEETKGAAKASEVELTELKQRNESKRKANIILHGLAESILGRNFRGFSLYISLIQRINTIFGVGTVVGIQNANSSVPTLLNSLKLEVLANIGGKIITSSIGSSENPREKFVERLSKVWEELFTNVHDIADYKSWYVASMDLFDKTISIIHLCKDGATRAIQQLFLSNLETSPAITRSFFEEKVKDFREHIYKHFQSECLMKQMISEKPEELETDRNMPFYKYALHGSTEYRCADGNQISKTDVAIITNSVLKKVVEKLSNHDYRGFSFVFTETGFNIVPSQILYTRRKYIQGMKFADLPIENFVLARGLCFGYKEPTKEGELPYELKASFTPDQLNEVCFHLSFERIGATWNMQGTMFQAIPFDEVEIEGEEDE